LADPLGENFGYTW